MPDLVRGETFVDGETVTGERLNRLVDNATIVDGAVTTAKLANGAVTTEKLATGAVIQAGAVALTANKFLVGNTENKGAPMGAGPEFALSFPDGFSLAAKGVAAAKIADGAVGTDQLATLDPSPAGTYGAAAKIPVLTVDSKGRVTAAAEAAITTGLVVKEVLPLKPFLWTPGGNVVWPHTLGAVPDFFQVCLECVMDTPSGGGNDPFYKVGDRIPIHTCFYSVDQNQTWPGFSIWANTAEVGMAAFGQGFLLVASRTTGVHVNISRDWPNNFNFRAVAMKVS